MSDGNGISTNVPEEEQLRAQQYRFLARWFARPADAELLEMTAGLEGDASEFGMAINALAAAARETTVEQAADEHFVLFVGLGRSEVMPYGSYYLTGFLNEKPVADLIIDMAQLGITRADGVKETEDHIASLCDCMAGLIMGEFGAITGKRESGAAARAGGPAPLSLGPQSAFFARHIATWAGRFFADLERSPSARLYRPVGTIGRLFMEIEETAFEMAA